MADDVAVLPAPRISNAELAMAKADMLIAERYVALVKSDEIRDRIWGRIREEYDLADSALLQIRDQEHLLDREAGAAAVDPAPQPVRRSAVVHRDRAAQTLREDPTDEDVVNTLHLAVNGIAGGLRNTG